MNRALLILCLAVATSTALPTNVVERSVLGYLKDLENVVQEDGKILMAKMIKVIHHVEDGVLQIKEAVPKAYEKIHQEADEVLAGLKKVTETVEEFLGRQKAQFGFDLLGSLTELSGGTKLSTVLNLLSLADKAHKVANDAKEFVPHLETTFNKIQEKIESHVTDFFHHIVKELGLPEDLANSVIPQLIKDLLDRVTEKSHELILDLLHKMTETLNILEEKLPEEYEQLKGKVQEVRKGISDLVQQIEATLAYHSAGLLDLAGNLTGGTDIGTAFKVMSLLDKFNTVVQDARGFGPKAEEFLERNVKKVADSAQDFFKHAAEKLFE